MPTDTAASLRSASHSRLLSQTRVARPNLQSSMIHHLPCIQRKARIRREQHTARTSIDDPSRGGIAIGRNDLYTISGSGRVSLGERETESITTGRDGHRVVEVLSGD